LGACQPKTTPALGYLWSPKSNSNPPGDAVYCEQTTDGDFAGDCVAFALCSLDRREGERAVEERVQGDARLLGVAFEEGAQVGQATAGVLLEAARLEVEGPERRLQVPQAFRTGHLRKNTTAAVIRTMRVSTEMVSTWLRSTDERDRSLGVEIASFMKEIKSDRAFARTVKAAANTVSLSPRSPLDEIDVQRLLGSWSWLIDRPLRPIELTRFGDWFLTDRPGCVYRLDALEGTLGPICDTVAEYQRRKTSLPELDTWFSEGMVDALARSGQVPGVHQGVGYRVPPIVGGSLEIDNIYVVELASWQTFMSGLHGAVRQLPPNARILGIEALDDGGIRIVTAGD
jgi:hypothetical protein